MEKFSLDHLYISKIIYHCTVHLADQKADSPPTHPLLQVRHEPTQPTNRSTAHTVPTAFLPPIAVTIKLFPESRCIIYPLPDTPRRRCPTSLLDDIVLQYSLLGYVAAACTGIGTLAGFGATRLFAFPGDFERLCGIKPYQRINQHPVQSMSRLMPGIIHLCSADGNNTRRSVLSVDAKSVRE